MGLDSELIDTLSLLGLRISKGMTSRTMNLLKIILTKETNPPIPLDFNEIYEEVNRSEEDEAPSKTWIHRILKNLVRIGLVRFESEAAYRKRFLADINTLAAGLEGLKTNAIEERNQEITRLTEEIDQIQSMDCSISAQELLKQLTGRIEGPTARSIRGIDELDRLLGYNICDPAEQGSIIRAAVEQGGSFLKGGIERTKKFVNAAMRGVEIRYMLSSAFFSRGDKIAEGFDPKKANELLNELIGMRKKGHKFDIRIYAEQKTYNQVSLNNERIALIITENPLCATLMTRKFNADLIDHAVEHFDRIWNSARSIFGLEPKMVEELLTKGPEFLKELMMKAAEA